MYLYNLDEVSNQRIVSGHHDSQSSLSQNFNTELQHRTSTQNFNTELQHRTSTKSVSFVAVRLKMVRYLTGQKWMGKLNFCTYPRAKP